MTPPPHAPAPNDAAHRGAFAVVIPAFNESDTVADVVRAAAAAGAAEIVVVSDGSADTTADVARRAGAHVIAFPENRGKSAALDAGIRAVRSDTIVMLDADLVGLSAEHLRRLLEPLKHRDLDMAIGVFRGGGLMTDLGNRATPFLSGQRACSREWLLSIPDLTRERWPEPAITRHLQRTGARWGYVPLPQLKQVMKEQKHGFLEGVRYRFRMYRQLLRYVVRPRRG